MTGMALVIMASRKSGFMWPSRPAFGGRSSRRLPRHRHVSLAQTAALDLDVGLGPDLLELGVDRLGFVILALAAEGVGQAVEAPAVVGEFFQVVAVDLLGLGDQVGADQVGAQAVP